MAKQTTMSAVQIYSLFSAFAITGVRADGWDEFANNLATDLAPLIALFGEQATKQFLSESLTWVDNFIFCRAPLGILTAVVSAIRVCGSSSLRAFIGRAQEGDGAAEAELCSSTSRNVCELYNNGGIARVLGRPKILEVIWDPDTDDFYEHTLPAGQPVSEPTCGIFFFEEYLRTKNGENEWREKGKRNNKSQSDEEKKQGKHEEQKEGDNPQMFAPNLSLNIGIKSPQPSLQTSQKRDGSALPWLAKCMPWEWEYAHVEPKQNASSLYWLQPGKQEVGDQVFDAFAYSDYRDPLEEHVTSYKSKQFKNQQTKVGVWVAICVTIGGFVLQFVGLRAMHSAVSVFQLGATLIMAVIRAGLRARRFRDGDNHFTKDGLDLDLVQGHELDWLATRFAENEPPALKTGKKPLRLYVSSAPFAPRNMKSLHTEGLQIVCLEAKGRWPDESLIYGSERGLTRGTPRLLSEAQKVHGVQSHEESQEYSRPNSACRRFKYRARLARMTSPASSIPMASTSAIWEDSHVNVRQCSRQLKSAIEQSPEILLSDNGLVKEEWKAKESIWRSTDRDADGLQGWCIDMSEIEALLGLWTWSMKRNSPDAPIMRRIISRGSKEAADIMLWMEKLNSKPSEDELSIQQEPHLQNANTLWETISGTAQSAISDKQVYVPAGRKAEYTKRPRSDNKKKVRFFGWQGSYAPNATTSDIISVTAKNSVTKMCAQEIFISFLCAVASIVADLGCSMVRRRSSNDFYLVNEKISKLINAFAESGIGSREDAFLCIIPAMQTVSKLPSLSQSLASARTSAADSRKRGDWEQSEDLLRWSFRTSRNAEEELLKSAKALGELYRWALVNKENDKRRQFDIMELGSAGIKWMRQQD
ncbi:hypothetical protein CNMCM8694_002614 [Aspergillus lentulus]|nr:hypothetical protein CNMCM8060_002868 [Aspergillus lentulus]KAF4190967.1 hypothetical protein CNMCM8694_002614 [Aspergillus lentulus]